MAQQLAEIEAAARRLANSVVCYGSVPQPGTVQLDNGQTFETRSGTWWVVDGNALETLKTGLADQTGWAAWSASDQERGQEIADLFQALAAQIVLKGRGPVAPTFDEFDREVEAARGAWYVIDGDALQVFRAKLERH